MSNKKQARTATIKVPASVFRYPGLAIELKEFVIFEGEKRSDKDRLSDEEKRTFEVLCILSKSLDVPFKIEIIYDNSIGTSYIRLPKGVKALKLQLNGNSFHAIPNKDRDISSIVFTCEASSEKEAIIKQNEVVMPVLDQLSFLCNVPVIVKEVLVRDKKNDSIYCRAYVPHTSVQLREFKTSTNMEMRPIFSLFREGKNSGSNYYKFLCYYKILEGLYKRVRPNIRKMARDRGITINTIKEVVPDHPGISSPHKDFIGQPIGNLFDNYFRQEHRRAIAHFETRDDPPAILSTYDLTSKIASATLLIEVCCLEVISNTLRYQSTLDSAVSSQ